MAQHSVQRPTRHVSAFEVIVHSFIDRFTACGVLKHDTSGMVSYTHLYSLYEFACAKWREAHDADTPNDVPSPQAEACVALELLREIALEASQQWRTQ
jgi:hypothetical protein